jgi:hypothetical protein
MSGEFSFIRDMPEFTFYDNIFSIFSIFRINQVIEYVNNSFKKIEEITDDYSYFNIYYDYDIDIDIDIDIEDKYII